ncbi:MAG: hypothetical protein HDT33_07305 [Clostridiales bacterium]|nr:hypothetical protein [Clostridiales bacterium]
MPGVVATQQLRALTQNKGRQERITWEELVRMRSPVQIWIAAPQNPPFSAENGGFVLLSAHFLALGFLHFGFDHIMSEAICIKKRIPPAKKST